MNQRALELQQTKKKMQGKGKKGGQNDIQVKEEQLNKLQSEWAREKEALAKEKEELMLLCKNIQDEIKEIKEKTAAWLFRNDYFHIQRTSSQ